MGRLKLLLSVLLLGASWAYSAPLPGDSVTENINDFSYGLFTNASSNKIPKNSSKDMRNMYVDDKIGSLVKANGWVLLGSTPTLQKVSFIGILNKPSGDKEFIVSDSSIVLATKDFNVWTLLRSGLNTNGEVSGRQIRDKFWIVNGRDNPFNYDGSSVNVLNSPKGKYIEYWQERVWLFNTPTDQSALYWTEGTTTDSVVMAPDDPREFPVDNVLYIGRGDGQVGTGMKVFGGRLHQFKERSAYTTLGDASAEYSALAVNTQVGFISNPSIVELDNVLYGQGQDGFYAFDKSNMTRITDSIAPDILNVQNSVSRVVSNVWDSKAQFDMGSYIYGSSSTIDGTLSISTYSDMYANTRCNGCFGTIEGNTIVLSSATVTDFTDFVVHSSTKVFPNDFYGYVSYVSLHARADGTSGNQIKMRVKNLRTGDIVSKTVTTPGAAFAINQFSFGQNSVFFTGSDINTGKLQIQVSTVGPFDSGTSYYEFFASTKAGNADIIFQQSTTGQYISEVSTISTAITFWNTFDSVRNTNGGNISFYIRTATSAVNITTYPWTPISPGAVINAPATNNYIQWASTINAISTTNASNIESVTISHIEGLASITRSFGIDWKNRWWIGVSTETSGNYPLIYVKSKNTNSNPNAWMAFDGIPIRCFARTNDVLYAGHASSGSVLRLDYGTNYNGTAITSYYETPDLPFDNTYLEKKIFEYWLDADKNTGTNLTLGTYVDNRAINNQTISLDGTGRLLRVIKNPNDSQSTDGKTFRFRFLNNELDKSMTIHGFSPVFMRTQVR